MEQQQYNWAYWLEKPEDTLAGSTEENLLQKIVKLPALDQNYLQLNQNRKPEHYYACTYYATVWAICDIMGYSEADYIRLVDAVVNEALRTGDYNPKQGAFTAVSAQIACRVHNQMFTRKISQFRTELGKSTFYTLLGKNYTMVVTYISGKDYAEDVRDGKLDRVDFWRNQGGHCIRWSNLEKQKKPTKPKILTALDNYYTVNGKPETGYRRYEVPVVNIPHLKSGSPYYNFAYFFIPSDLL